MDAVGPYSAMMHGFTGLDSGVVDVSIDTFSAVCEGVDFLLRVASDRYVQLLKVLVARLQ